MTQNLSLRWEKHAVSAAATRGIDFCSMQEAMQNPPFIIPGNFNLREVFIIKPLVCGEYYPVAVPVSAGTDGHDAWLTVKTAIPKREYKSLFPEEK